MVDQHIFSRQGKWFQRVRRNSTQPGLQTLQCRVHVQTILHQVKAEHPEKIDYILFSIHREIFLFFFVMSVSAANQSTLIQQNSMSNFTNATLTQPQQSQT